MNEKDTLKNIIGLAASAGLTMATTSGSNIIVGLLNTVAGGILGNYVNDLNYSKLKALIYGINPSDLNHDIKKVILQAVSNSVKLICDTYNKKYFLAGYQKDRLNDFEQNLLLELKHLKNKIYNEEDSIYSQIENPKSVDSLFELFDISVESFPDINSKYPFGEYFKQEFIAMLQLCFGEALKAEKNRPALIAYQRDVYQTLDKKLDHVLAQNARLLERIDSKQEAVNLESYNQTLTKVKYEISSKDTSELLPEFKKQLDDYYTLISKDLNELTSVIHELRRDVSKNWIAKNKVYILGAGVGLLLIVAFIGYKYVNKPFNSIVKLSINKTLKIHSEYPKLAEKENAEIVFYLDKIENRIYTRDGIALTDMSKELLDEKIKIELIDPYWEFSTDSMTLKEGNVILEIQPNDKLASVRGRVFHHIGHAPVKNATVRLVMEGIETRTDSKGIFNIQVPMESRKPIYDIRIIAEGLDSITEKCVPGFEKPIGLYKQTK